MGSNSLNIEKAFDQVEWGQLYYMLKKAGIKHGDIKVFWSSYEEMWRC